MSSRILIVDDEVNVRETMRIALESAGYEVQTADDGQEALLHFEHGEKWDLILLDQRMPGMDGLEVLRIVRERDPSARVVMATAYGTIELAVEAMKLGAVDFLRKPFTPDILRGAVQVALDHPRETPAKSKVTRLTEGPVDRETPLIHFRTLNGYQLWPIVLADGEEETESLRVRRGFEVRSPDRALQRCAVDVTTSVRGQVREITGKDYPAQDPLWDMVCRSALSNFLWEHAQFPPESLAVYTLTREQVQNLRSAAGVRVGRS